MPGSRDIRAGGAFVEFSLRKGQLNKQLADVRKQLNQFGRDMARGGAQLAAAGAAIVAPLTLATKRFLDVGDQLNKASQRTGVTVEALSELKFAAEQSGAGFEILETGIRSMQRSINDLGRGLSTQKDAFGDLGVTLGEIKDLKPEDQFLKIAQSLSKIQDPSKRAALAMQVFGRAGQRLLPLLNPGAGGIEALRQQARDFGIVTSSEAAESAAALTDSFNILAKQAESVAIAIGNALSKPLVNVAENVGDVAKETKNWVEANEDAIVAAGTLGVTAGGAGVAAAALAKTIMVLGGVASGAGGVVAALGVAVAGITAYFRQGTEWADAYNRGIGRLFPNIRALINEFDAASEAARRIAEVDASINKTQQALGAATGTQERVRLVKELLPLLKEQRDLVIQLAREDSELMVDIFGLTGGRKRQFDDLVDQTNTARKELERLEAVLAGENLRQLGQDIADPFVDAGTKIADTVREISRAAVELSQKQLGIAADINRFTASSPIQAQVLSIEQQRLNLLKRAKESGLLSPETRQRINDAADDKIREVETANATALQQEIERQRITVSKRGLEQRLALINLEERQALQQAKRNGLDPSKITELANLRRQIARQEEQAFASPLLDAVRGITSSFNIRSVGGQQGSIQALNNTAREQLGVLKDISRRQAANVVGAGFAII